MGLGLGFGSCIAGLHDEQVAALQRVGQRRALVGADLAVLVRAHGQVGDQLRDVRVGVG